MKWIKVILIGVLATLSMDIVMNVMMIILDISPTNIHPSAAFLYNLGIEHSLLAKMLHYSYGILWAIVFMYAFEEAVSINRGIQLAGVLWLFMMIVYSPVIGWGFFGFGEATLLDPNHPLFLSSTYGYIVLTLIVHIIYGAVFGGLTQKFVKKKK